MALEDTQLDERLKSLRIDRDRGDRGPSGSGGEPERSPKLLILAASAVVVLVAFGLFYFLRGPKTVTVGEVGTENANGPSAGETVLSASGYLVAAHRIDVGAKVLGRVIVMASTRATRFNRAR